MRTCMMVHHEGLPRLLQSWLLKKILSIRFTTLTTQVRDILHTFLRFWQNKDFFLFMCWVQPIMTHYKRFTHQREWTWIKTGAGIILYLLIYQYCVKKKSVSKSDTLYTIKPKYHSCQSLPLGAATRNVIIERYRT